MVGARLGAAGGTLVEPGLGTAVGGIVFGFIGAAVGAYAGYKLGERTGDVVYDWAADTSFFPLPKVPIPTMPSNEELMSLGTIEVRREWDGALLQTADLVPKSGVAVLLEYSLDLDYGEGDLPLAVAKALAQGLTACGTVAGRWLDESTAAVASEAVLWVPERMNLLQRLDGLLRHTGPAPVVTTRSASVVFELLNLGWSMQAQALLVLGPEEISRVEAVQALQVRRDWTTFIFPPPARVLVAPGVDGDVIVVAAANEPWLKEALECLGGAFRAMGLGFNG